MSNLRNWQVRTLSSVWITYFAYYLCRYNMPIAQGDLCETFAWDTSEMGIVFSSLTIMYAIGQFVNGQLADRFGGRIIASLGVLGSVVMNLAVFTVVRFSSPGITNPKTAHLLITLFWGANGFFQAMGWSPMGSSPIGSLSMVGVRLRVYWGLPIKSEVRHHGFSPFIAFLLAVLSLCSIVFPYLPDNSELIIFIVAVIGFCTYGPHILMVGHAAQDFGKKSGSAGAAGFIDAMGYIGASLAGWGAGVLIKRWGYNVTFVLFGLAGL